MVNFSNLFTVFIILNYDSFLHNIKASNNNILKKEEKKVLTLENIQEEKYEINGTISFWLPNSIYQKKHVKITEIEYDAIVIKFVDKEGLTVNIEESEFHEIIDGDLKSKDRDYYFEIISVIFKVTAFIEEKCFHTILWYDYSIDTIKISTSLPDQLLELFNQLESKIFYNCILLMLPQNCFDSTTYSNSKCSENQNIYNVDISNPEQIECLLSDLTINKDSKIYNINHFIFAHVDLEVYIKIYYGTIDHEIIEGYIGKNTNQCNMNENILVSCTKTNNSYDENNNNTIQNKNSFKTQSVPENTPGITKISYNTQTDGVKNPNPDLINRRQCCQKKVEVKETQTDPDNSDTENADYKELEKLRRKEKIKKLIYLICNIVLLVIFVIILIIECIMRLVRWWRNRNKPERVVPVAANKNLIINLDNRNSNFANDNNPLPSPSGPSNETNLTT